ncbi:AIPR family protein [Lyngbya sp. CCY1209]|uniref:AIPR family protein n=1 Tax=Lyngbya sp. CCY1209 TaxID=2886103 RepID=UPI002D20B047|nr:AIPR family protein [Lyngbya sp. CCY1209]MEB3884995.1 AIPR family protein [Lyngbya sp. CCY1209]
MSISNVDAQKAQVIDVLKQRYFPLIPQLLQNWTPEQHETNRLSRSLAAFAIEKLADVTPAQAANAIVNGENDNGIDAIFFDRSQNRLWVVQAKAGSRAPNMGENKKFCDGIRDLVNSRFDKFSDRLSRLQSDIEEALGTTGLIVVGCNVYLVGHLGSHVIRDLKQLKTELNQFSSRFDWQDLDISAVHRFLTEEQAITSFSVTLTLEKWYGVDRPRKAFYGLVSADQLALLYQQYGRKLFERNIRYYLGAEGVNSAITATVQNQPEELLYLNNGLTAVCSNITLPPNANNDSGKFTLEGFSIVNGAQTVGSIATACNNTSSVSPDAKLLITIIEIGKEQDTLAKKITQARNTQNAVKDIYFAALEETQERLRQELAVSGIIYQYRPSIDRSLSDVITIEQAIIALACFKGKTQIIVTAKKESGQLYPLFKEELFSDRLSGIELCRSVQIFQYLEQIFTDSEAAETERRRKNFYRHGKYFILHILARRHQRLIKKTELVLSEDDKIELSRIGLELAELIYTVAESQCDRQKGYLAIFRNLTDVEPLARAVMQRLADRDTP